ncbi:MAG: electron transfer flavoprotein subunit alpha/FixB family protein [SAR324 cluster bacterium]|nr:electron transfer flavoprotein subunit alpha/FixB family protein [SAR324 cluster bacterium]
MAKILVVAEVKGGQVKKPSLELLSFAKSKGLEVDAVVMGSGVAKLADTLAGQGANKVYVADDASLALYSTLPYASAVVDAVKQSGATQVWLTSSESGKDLTPRVAARLGVGALPDVKKLEINGDDVVAYRPAMATKVIQKVTFSKPGIRVISVRGGSFDVAPAESKAATVVNLSIPQADNRVIVKEVVTESGGQVELTEANVIVSVGRGVKGTEGVEFVKPLSSLLGAAFGASRAVCDAGWMPHSAQVGQTGKVVAPSVYFAVGISGAIQHLAGMSGSKVIVAVNKDPEAPIFKVADYGIVGDLFKAVPVLIEEIKKAKG